MRDLAFDRSSERAPQDLPRIGGRYVVEAEIARGGVGRVLRVRHRELDKRFALKLLGPAAGAEARGEFYREARLAAALDHPNVIQVYDFGEDPRCGLFLVMELLAGESAARRLARLGRLRPIAACDVIGQTASALEYMHGRGLVHGDVKPHNLFLAEPRSAETDGPGQETRRTEVRLLDFGLARRAHDARRPAGARRIEGTASYLAPELMLGGEPTVASDLYALGVTLYELVVGRPPFVGPPGDVMVAHLRQPPPPISDECEVAPELAVLVERLLAKSPGERPSDARAVMAALRGCVEALGGRRKERPPAGRARLSEAVLDSLGLGVFIASPSGAILLANPAAARHVGRAEAESSLWEGPLARRFPGMGRDFARVLGRGAELRSQAVQGRRRLELRLSPHRRHGAVVGVCGIIDESAMPAARRGRR